jgi:alkyldihydroxyacetonephosphate synthase
MRRWNGWGDAAITYPLPPSARAYLESAVGVGESIPDADLQSVLDQVPAARLPENPLFTTDPLERVLHARGHSLPDWVALRSGAIRPLPDGVSFPETEQDIRNILGYAKDAQIRLIPYGGGTSVVGHINPLPGDIPVLTVDLSRLDRLITLDKPSRTATFQAGVRGPHLEEQLRQQGYTLGHFPQSFELSTLGGWIATRSSGQQSYYYGRIEDAFAGGVLHTFDGDMEMPCLPASAAGPDLRQVVLGSEGRLGIISRASVRIHPLPEMDGFYAAFFHDWEAGSQALRTIAQERIPLSMLRLSDETETETTLELSGKENQVRWANRGLNWLGYPSGRSLLIYAATGRRRFARMARRQAEEIIRAHHGLLTGGLIGHTWQKKRFLTPYLRNTLWDAGFAIDTLETALPWSSVMPAARQIQAALRSALQDGERVLVFTHLSHIYTDGASIYTTFLFRRSRDPQITLERWSRMKSAASQQIIACKGTISHQHGVGADHLPYLYAEKGQLGLEAIQALSRQFDPLGLLNPGKLIQ